MSDQEKSKLQEVIEDLEKGIQGVFDSDKFKNYLSFMSKFHSYSYSNVMLILMQKPEASLVAGYKAWQTKFDRQVNKGEKGIVILAPAPFKTTIEVEKVDPATNKPIKEREEITKLRFRPAYVFDVSQTSGEPIPSLTAELQDSVLHYDLLFQSIREVSPFTIVFEDIKGGAKGYCRPSERKIALKEGMAQAQNIKTTIHEITHANLHGQPSKIIIGKPKDRRTEEVEAESVAYVVCNHFGIDTSDYSFAYLASWSRGRELKELKSSLDTIQRQAADLIHNIETRFRELLKEQEKRLQNELLDTVRYDNDIDLDKVRTREQLGFRDYPMSERMVAAQEASKTQVQDRTQNPTKRHERGDR